MSQQLVVSHSNRFQSSPHTAIQRAPALVRIPAQHHLYQQGEPASAAFVIRSGIACLESVNHRGDRCIVHFLGSGALIGHEAWLGQPRCFDARACTDLVLEPVAMALRSGQTRHENTVHGSGEAVSNLFEAITKFRVELHGASARQRVLLLLEQLKKGHAPEDTALWLPSRQEMADALDINHATASRVVAHLYRERVLLRGSRNDDVGVDWSKLHRLMHTEQPLRKRRRPGELHEKCTTFPPRV